MPDDRRVIKVAPDVFERLKAGKAKHQTWNHYLNELAEKAEDTND